MRACRLISLARKSAPFSLQKLAPFSPSAAATVRSSNYSSDKEEEGFSVVYRDKLKFQRPPTIKSTGLRFNSVSFIGYVRLPPKILTSRMGDLGVLAYLDVTNTPQSKRSFRISLSMWGKMADTFIKHFTCNDFIYVSGRLGFCTYDRSNGERITEYQVIVKELNFVAPRHQGTICHKLEESQPQKGLGEAGLDKYKTGLNLWEAFFSNRSEWLDWRETKESSMHPDFVHIDTDKGLWQWPNDPPWIKEQLEVLDRQMGKQSSSRDDLEKRENDLWQEFFAHPYEWYDGRERKKNPRQPDFVRMHTGEALWLNPRVEKQLESLDLKMANQGQGEASLEKYKDDLYLWQVFFANPGEWWDNRNNKKNPRAPDFVHKDTREVLWLNPNDPPWIKKQLDSLDARRAEQGLGEDTGRQSLWNYV